MKKPMRTTTTETIVKNAVNNIVKYISIISIFIAIGLIALLYAGPEINLVTAIVMRLAVPSIVLAVSIIIIYNLWITNGKRAASEEIEYHTLLTNYELKSRNLYYPTLQDFLDYEEKRRYNVEYATITRDIDRQIAIVSKLTEKIDNKKFTKIDVLRLKLANRLLLKLHKTRDRIKVTIPYKKSEEFDYLRYNLQDIIYKEYSPNDTRKHLRSARTKKYIGTLTFTLIGFNVLSIGGSLGEIWVAIIMTALATVALLTAVMQGFAVGYHNIKVISTGVYNTAVSFLDQAVAYCDREHKNLYYKGPNQFRELEEELPSLDGSELYEDELNIEKNIFTQAAKEVTKNSNY